MTNKQKLFNILTAANETGLKVILAYVRILPENAGVYRMLNKDGDVLYIGKAKNLKKRVMSYTQPQRLPVRLQRMISETSKMEFVTTQTETEALLLEANFIKKLEPRYNILLKDSKFFSYIALTSHQWPRLYKYRGQKNSQDQYFGPFASAEAVDNSLISLYKIFKIRSCTDSFFASRKRPCMQYHIKRCSAPCVHYIEQEKYQYQVQKTADFLHGKTNALQNELALNMELSSKNRDYEQAASYRDQIQALTKLQSRQTINTAIIKDADIFGLYQNHQHVCIQIFFFRAGSNYGSFSIFPKHVEDQTPGEILSSVLPLFYTDKDCPREIYVSHGIADKGVIEQALSKNGSKVQILTPVRGEKLKFIEHAVLNAQNALERYLAQAHSFRSSLNDLAQLLNFQTPIHRVEVYDNSHISGQDAIGAMIVVGSEGFQKKYYRKFTIRNPSIMGDDYGMMREVILRRFKGTLDQNRDENPLPDLLLIDGGQGQVNVTQETLDFLNLKIPILGIAKGPKRNAGQETFYMPQGIPSFKLDQQSKLLYFLQRIRDESHRFAIGTHRAKRMKRITETAIMEIPGIGALRKKALLRYFGSSKAVMNARIEDLKNVEGISAALAHKIYAFFHNS